MAVGDPVVQWHYEIPPLRKIFLPGTTGLLAAYVVGYILFALLPQLTFTLFGLHPGAGLLIRPWQMVTYPFLTGPCSFLWAVAAVLILGSAVERQWRTGPLLMLWALTTVGCGILWCLFWGIPVGGGSGYFFSVLAVCGCIFRNRRLHFPPVRVDHLVLVVIGLYLVLAVGRPDLFIWIAGAGIGWCCVRYFRWRDRRQAGAPALSAHVASPPRKGFVDID